MKRKNKLCLTAGAAMALALGLWMASYLLEAALSADCVHQNRKMRCFDNGTNQTR